MSTTATTLGQPVPGKKTYFDTAVRPEDISACVAMECADQHFWKAETELRVLKAEAEAARAKLRAAGKRLRVAARKMKQAEEAFEATPSGETYRRLRNAALAKLTGSAA